MSYIQIFILCIILNCVLIFAQEDIPQFPSISEIQTFCQDTEQMLQKNNAPTPISSNSAAFSKEFCQKWNQLVNEEQKILEDYITNRKKQKNWNRDERALFQLLIEFGLYEQSKFWIQDQINRSSSWAETGNAYLRLALLQQQTGNFPIAQNYLEKAEQVHSEFWDQIKNTRRMPPHESSRWKDDWNKMQQDWNSKSSFWEKRYADYVIASRNWATDPQSLTCWETFMRTTLDLEYTPEVLAGFTYWMKNFSKTQSNNLPRSFILYTYTRKCIQTHQPDRALNILNILETEKDKAKYESDICYLKAYAYAQKKQKEPARKWQAKLRQQFPQYVQEKKWEMQKLEDAIIHD